MNILGLSAFYHESTCCLLQDGRLVAAASEERFSRRKHDPGLPVEAFRFCLQAGGIDIVDLDALAYYERPVDKLARQLWAGVPANASPDLAWLDPGQPERALRERLGFAGPILTYPHHLSHAASAFLYSGFPEAAVLTVDGVGEWATTTYGRGDLGAAEVLDIFEEVRFPHSLGPALRHSHRLPGFPGQLRGVQGNGLAPYGEPRHLDRLRRLLQSGPQGGFTLDLRYFDFVRGRRMYSEGLCDLLGSPARRPGGEITSFHRDVARSLQALLEEVLLDKARYLHQQTGSRHLCLAGGVALNCVANARILREGPFERLFIPPAAGDAGGALGAAALAQRALDGGKTRPGALRRADLGPRWGSDEIAAWLGATGLIANNLASNNLTSNNLTLNNLAVLDFRGREADLLEAVVDRLVERQVVGWFHGGMELGPRALGARSLLADPRDPEMRERLNRLIKKRESFRPFAPSVLEAQAGEHFDLDHPSPFMLETCQVTSPLALPAITHVDGSARPQTVDPAELPRFAALLAAFARRTGCPILLNTSFNVADEPIVCSPADALFSLGTSGIDCLVLEDFLLDRSALPEGWGELLAAWQPDPGSPFARQRTVLGESLYTFV